MPTVSVVPAPINSNPVNLQGGATTAVPGVAPATLPQLGPVAAPAPAAAPAPVSAPAQPVAPAVPAPNPPAPVPAPKQTFTLGNGQSYDINGNPVASPASGADQGTEAGNAQMSATDFLSLLGSETATNSKTLSDIYAGLGIPQTAVSAFATPAQSTVDVYNQAYSTAGLADLKQKIADFNDQIASTNQEYIKAVGEANEDPFLSEAARVGRTQDLYNTAQETMGNLLNEQSNYQNLYAQGVNEVNNLVTRYTNDFTTNQSVNVSKLNYLLQQAEAQEGATQNTNIQALLARYAPQYLDAYAQTAAAEKPFGSEQSGLYTYNPTTKTYTQVTPPAGNQTPITTPTGGVIGFNTNTGQTTATGANIYNPNPTPSASGSFPQGAQQQPGSAASVNNVSGMKDPATGQFIQYSDPAQSFAATVSDIQAKQTGNTSTGLNANSTLSQFVNTWVNGKPDVTGGNYTAQDVATSLQQMGVQANPNTPIGSINATQLATAIAQHETGYTPAQNVGGAAGPAQSGVGGPALTVQSAPNDGGASQLIQAFQNVASSLDATSYGRNYAQLNQYLQSGNTTAAMQLVTTLAYKQMQPAVQSKVDNVSQAIDAYQQALAILDQHPELSTGVYQNITQNAKPWAGANPTGDYQQFTQLMNIGNSLIDSGLYGVRLNPTDEAVSGTFKPGSNDPTATIISKLKGAIGFFNYANAQAYSQQTGVPAPDLGTFLQQAGYQQ